ncbi:Globin-like protein [Pseudocohnilembus persalinus]|uniref:Globin-like protein n=1 Tax=Pseudocohnilembus persalinus TaxID=266149 RepID=A0A0V0QT83_PSEPJ|nr:Globin-like protein [Pseudocohnilembus persalinus]|eukprot:KRX05502.1 Globin-like protein [Pseudocohnilembus persalinus]
MTLKQLLGGQNKYTGRNIIKIHENMGISDIEFNKAMEYLQNAFLKYNISEDLTKKCMEIIQNTGEKIVEKKIKQKQEELKKQQQQEQLKQQQQKQRSSLLQNKPLIVRLGGVPSIDILTEQFFDRVIDDETLGKYFRNLDLEKQKKQLTVFLVQIFGGEVRYRGKDMKMAHNNLKITEELYNKFVDTLIESMEIMKIPIDYQKEAKKQILTTKSDIVNTLTPTVPIIQQIGGPEILKELYSGVKLEELHKNLKITPDDYTEFCKILIKVMKQMNFTTATIRGIGKIIDTLKPKIAFG